jgi:hypothetical protein
MCGRGLCHLAWILNQSAIINALGPKPSVRQKRGAQRLPFSSQMHPDYAALFPLGAR